LACAYPVLSSEVRTTRPDTTKPVSGFLQHDALLAGNGLARVQSVPRRLRIFLLQYRQREKFRQFIIIIIIIVQSGGWIVDRNEHGRGIITPAIGQIIEQFISRAS
jgi:hypothetical protein